MRIDAAVDFVEQIKKAYEIASRLKVVKNKSCQLGCFELAALFGFSFIIHIPSVAVPPVSMQKEGFRGLEKKRRPNCLYFSKRFRRDVESHSISIFSSLWEGYLHAYFLVVPIKA